MLMSWVIPGEAAIGTWDPDFPLPQLLSVLAGHHRPHLRPLPRKQEEWSPLPGGRKERPG